MEKRLAFEQIGWELIRYIKEESPYTMAEVADKTLGITYANFQRRLSKNNIKLYELEKVLNFLQLDLSLSIGETTFQNTSPGPTDYEAQLAQQDRLLQLQDKIIQLQERLQEYQTKRLKDKDE